MPGTYKTFTQQLSSGSITIVAADNVQKVSVLCSTGNITVTGTGTFQGNASAPVTLTVGQAVTITSDSANTPIDGWTINAGGGGNLAQIVISQQ
jgi:hypothetical protein